MKVCMNHTLPFFLLLMTSLATILSMSTLKKSENVKFLVLGIITSIIIFYLDLSIALGQTDRIPIILSIWAPFALSSLIFVGILQINENKIFIFCLFFSSKFFSICRKFFNQS